MVSGCRHGSSDLRLGDCNSLVWRASANLGEGVLRISYRSDSDPNRDPNDATVFRINGGEVERVVHNTGCHPTDCEIVMPWPAGSGLLEVASHSTSMAHHMHVTIEAIVHHQIGPRLAWPWHFVASDL